MPSMKTKTLSAIKMNIRELPYHIAVWKNKKEWEKVAQGERILNECRAELDRRISKGAGNV